MYYAIPSNSDQLMRRFDLLRPGQSFVYFEGYIPKAAPIDELMAYTALELYEKGTAILTQRRLGEFYYEYIITKREIPIDQIGNKQ